MGGGRLLGIFVCNISFVIQGGGRLLKQGRLLRRLRYMPKINLSQKTGQPLMSHPALAPDNVFKKLASFQPLVSGSIQPPTKLRQGGYRIYLPISRHRI